MKIQSLPNRICNLLQLLPPALQKWMHYFTKHPHINFDFNLQFIAALYESDQTVELTSVFIPSLAATPSVANGHPGCCCSPVEIHCKNICMHNMYSRILCFIALLFPFLLWLSHLTFSEIRVDVVMSTQFLLYFLFSASF